MGKRIATISGGVCKVIVNQPANYVPGANEVDVTSVSAGPGWLYDGSTFTAPYKVLTEAEFIKLGYVIDMDGVDAALAAMPGMQRLLAQYTNMPGLKYEDAIDSNTSLGSMINRIVSEGYFTAEQRTAFLTGWPRADA